MQITECLPAVRAPGSCRVRVMLGESQIWAESPDGEALANITAVPRRGYRVRCTRYGIEQTYPLPFPAGEAFSRIVARLDREAF